MNRLAPLAGGGGPARIGQPQLPVAGRGGSGGGAVALRNQADAPAALQLHQPPDQPHANGQNKAPEDRAPHPGRMVRGALPIFAKSRFSHAPSFSSAESRLVRLQIAKVAARRAPASSPPLAGVIGGAAAAGPAAARRPGRSPGEARLAGLNNSLVVGARGAVDSSDLGRLTRSRGRARLTEASPVARLEAWPGLRSSGRWEPLWGWSFSCAFKSSARSQL